MSLGADSVRKEAPANALRTAAANAWDFVAVCSRAMATGWKHAPGLSAGLWSMLLVQSAAPATTAYLYKGMVDALVAAAGTGGPGAGAAWRALGLYLLVHFAVNQMMPALSAVRDQLSQRLEATGSKALMEAVLSHHDLSPFEDQAYFNDLQSVRDGLADSYRFVVQMFPNMVSTAVVTVSYLAIAATFHPMLVVALTVGDIALYTSALFGAAGQIEVLSRSYGFLSRHYKTLDLYRRFLKRPQAIRVAADGVPFAGFRRGITLRGVSFRYPGSEGKSLDGIDLELPAGRVIALVGENGAGKTTLVKLLTRLFDPSEGEIEIDGTPLPEFDLTSYRRGVTAVFQDFGRYEMSVRENVGVADIGRVQDDDAIMEAARQAGAEELIRGLPGGIDQVLGRRFTGGRELSGGEWQKIALARAFLRSDARLVILDEPTAALDARAEYEIFKRFAELSAGRTTILVSHRFSTVRMADLIVVMEKGRVIETGSHAELMAAGGTYAELYSMQSERYR